MFYLEGELILGVLQFTLKVIGNMIMSLEPCGEEQEMFRANFKLISSSFASLPFKIPGTAFHCGIKVTFLLCYKLSHGISQANLFWTRMTKSCMEHGCDILDEAFVKINRVLGFFSDINFHLIRLAIGCMP